MKRTFKKNILLLILLLASGLLFHGCHEKGCTDRNAVNFNIVADEDDGSCIVCKTTQSQTGALTALLTDFNSSSPHFNETVARIDFRQITDNYNNSACGGNHCVIYYKVENLVSQEMDLPFFVSVSGSNLFFSFSNFVQIPATQTTVEDSVPANVSNACGLLSSAFVNFGTNGTIVYH